MKTFYITIVFIFLSGVSVFAQRWAYVDSQVILRSIPDYNSAQKQLDALSQQWQKEGEERQNEIDKLSKEYQAQWPLLTDEMRKRSESEIAEKERALREFQSAKFGPGGELFQQNIKLIRPIQDKVAKAIQIVAEKQNLDHIDDKASGTMLYGNPRYDKTDDVIREMGYKPLALEDK